MTYAVIRQPSDRPRRGKKGPEDVMLKWCLLVEAGRRTGHTYAQPDLIIAATALHHGLTVVSRNVAHFERADVPVVNPWTRKR